MFQLFLNGGPVFMGILTVLLVAIFFAAWKAPRWVKYIGSIALVFGMFSSILGIYQAMDYIQMYAEEPLSQPVIAGGIKCATIPFLYGIIIYIVSAVVRIFQTPRL